MVGFSSNLRIWENVRRFIPHLHFFSSFFLKWRLAGADLFYSLGQDQSTVAQQAETTMTKCSLMSCMWARFLIGSHTMPGQWHSQPTPTSLDKKVYACLGVTCHLQFWQNGQGLLRATAVTRGWNRHRIRVSTQSWHWRRKFSYHFCRDSDSNGGGQINHESGALTNKLSRLPVLT